MTTRYGPTVPDRLLVSLDGSNASEQAVPIAREIARQCRIPVTILHVFKSIRALTAACDGDIDYSEDADPRASIRPIAPLKRATEQFELAGVDVDVLGRVGDPAEEINREHRDRPRTWLVMTSFGSSGLFRMLLGSVARTVIRRSSGPVLLVPARQDGPAPSSDVELGRMAVFLDGTRESEQAIRHTAAVAEAMSAELDLVRVAETLRDDPGSSTPDDDIWEQPARSAVHSYLLGLAEQCEVPAAQVNAVPLAGTPDVQLIKYTRETSPGLIGLAIRKRSDIERWTYGSLAERLLDSLGTPILLVPVEGN